MSKEFYYGIKKGLDVHCELRKNKEPKYTPMSNDNFKWTDQLVKEFGDWYKNTSEVFSPNPLILVDRFKASHSSGIVDEKDWEIVEYFNAAERHHNPTVQCERSGCKIFSVKRKSDGVVFSVGNEDVSGDAIESFKIVGNGMGINFSGGGHLWIEQFQLPQPIPQRIKLLGCNICGGELVMIRGRYPNHDKRQVCPTCNTERLEQINEISSKLYGVAMQETKINPIS